MFELGLKYVGMVSHISIPIQTHNHEVVCEGASQGGGSGRPTAEVHEHDMTNTGTGKSGYIVEY